MVTIDTRHPLALAVAEAIHTGDLLALKQLLDQNPSLVSARFGDDDADGMSRTLLHVATDWPGHFPNGPAVVGALIAAGVDVNARFASPHTETPLHWAASSDDVEVLEVLLDAGADIEATGGVIGNGTPLADARTFGQWRAAHRLVERGARTTLKDAATLGLMERVPGLFEGGQQPTLDEVTNAFWGACHGGQQRTAEYLLERGANLNWIGYDGLTPLDAARHRGADQLVEWLRNRSARSAQNAD
jgi:ankyrin repeat protein